ncbi:Periplasmic beta-glucosidase precursor [compost metagenome]
MSADRPLEARVTVTNTGNMAGIETVQLYIRDMSGETVRPVKELKDFRQLQLVPGESREVVFQIGESQLRYHHSDLAFSSDPGMFTVYVGASSRDTQSAAFRLV